MPTGKNEFRATRISNIAEKIIRQILLLSAACCFALGTPFLVQAALGHVVMDCKQMKPGQLQSLPDEQKVSCSGEEKMVGEIRREWQGKRQRGQVQAEQARAEAQAKLQELQKVYGPEIPLEEAEAKMRVELAKLKRQGPDPERTKGQLDKIRHQAVRLEQQMQRARGPKEKVQIEAQAKELAEQLFKMGSRGDKYEYLFAKICQLIDCGLLNWFPHIDSVLLFSVISPNGPIIISGRDFGTIKGTLWIKGLPFDRKMIIDSWSDGSIGAFFPSALAIGTVVSPKFSVQVETSQGLESNFLSLKWVQEVKLLDTDSVEVDRCGEDGNLDSCNWTSYDTVPGCFSAASGTDMIFDSKPPDPNCPCSARGFHGNCWGAPNDDSGQDVYKIGLKNAWKMVSFTFGDSLPKVDSCDDAEKPKGFLSGSSTWTPKINWCVTPNDNLKYWLWVYIVGPKGFQHTF